MVHTREAPGACSYDCRKGPRLVRSKREECFCGSRVARLGLRSRRTGTSRQEPLKFELQFSQVAQANAMGNGPQTGAALRRFAPGANRNRPRKLGLTSAHVK